MTTIREQIDTTLPIDAAFAYVADFANSQEWDPGAATSERIGGGPVGAGSRFRLGVRIGGRVAPMEYRITEFDPPRRVVLVGPARASRPSTRSGSHATPTGTRIDYTADIRLGGLLRLAAAVPRRRVREDRPQDAPTGCSARSPTRAGGRRDAGGDR